MKLMLSVSLFGAIGSVLRYVLDVIVTGKKDKKFPVGTVLVNLAGSVAVGILLAFSNELTSAWYVIFKDGVLGGFTTFSAASFEVARFIAVKDYISAFILGVVVPAFAFLICYVSYLVSVHFVMMR